MFERAETAYIVAGKNWTEWIPVERFPIVAEGVTAALRAHPSSTSDGETLRVYECSLSAVFIAEQAKATRAF